jgi:hypothetical protein
VALVLYLFVILPPTAEAVSAAFPAGQPLPGTQAWTAASLLRANVSYSIWVVTGREVVLRFLVPAWEADAAMGKAPFLIVQQRLGKYLLEHMSVAAASGRTCPPEDQGYDLGKIDPVSVGAGLYGFEIFFRCPVATGLVLTDSALFDLLPGHVNFARVAVNGRFEQELFTAGKAQLRMPDAGALRSAATGRYASLALRYLFQRLDWICFLLGSVALLAIGRNPLWVAAGLAASLASGLLLSLIAALSDGVAPHSPVLLEAFVGFLVVLPVARYVSTSMNRRTLAVCAAMALLIVLSSAALFFHRSDAAILLAGAALLAGGMLALPAGRLERLLWLLLPATLLGLVEGFTLPQALRPLELSPADRLPMLSGFDFGLLLSELAVLLCAAGLSRGFRQKGSVWQVAIAADIAAAVVGGLGFHQLVSRIYR